MKRTHGLHPDAQEERARGACRQFLGEAGLRRREADIDALPSKDWKGRPVYDHDDVHRYDQIPFGPWEAEN